MEKKRIERRYFWPLVIFLVLATLPWLGLTDFNTKGEPREAIVSQTMIEQANWILPHNNGGEMAYKPPFFHWCGAAVATAVGQVNEFTARFPSALAGILMTVWTFVFYARRKDSRTALLAALVMFSCFEVHRAVFAARVDMVLTFCIVGALFAMARWAERDRPWWNLPWLGILLMGCGALTKGPVAVILPCGVTGLFMLLRGRNFFRAFLTMAVSFVLALVLPAMWYWAAYQQGGDEFLRLVKEENIDRFLGKMSYSSHENGLWYYPVMLLAGLLPWAFVLLWQWWKNRRCVRSLLPLSEWLKDQWKRLRQMDSVSLFSLLAFTVVFVFYCIPKSKRGVYILPVYPFAAWYIACLIRSWKARTLRHVFMVVLTIWFAVDVVALPLILNPKTDRDIAQEVTQIIGDEPITSYVSGGAPGNPMHYFTINFYMHNRVDVWHSQMAAQPEGYLLVGEGDAHDFLPQHPEYEFKLVYTSSHVSCDTHQKVQLYCYRLR